MEDLELITRLNAIAMIFLVIPVSDIFRKYDKRINNELLKYNINYKHNNYENMSDYQKEKFDEVHTKMYMKVYWLFCLTYIIWTSINLFVFIKYNALNINNIMILIFSFILITIPIFIYSYLMRRDTHFSVLSIRLLIYLMIPQSSFQITFAYMILCNNIIHI